jgi:hypothetical protein
VVKRLVLLLVALSCVVVTAQQSNPKLRGRWGGRVGVPGEPVAPRVTIDTPTLQPSTTVASAALTLGGTAEPGSSPIASVTWACATCSPTSGTATGTTAWVTAGGSGAQTVALDDFTGAANQPLSVLTASPVGGAWAEAVNTTTGYLERRSAGYVQINTSFAAGGSPTVINTVTPSPAITATNYDVSVTLTAVATSSDDGAGLIFGYQNSTNYCAVFWYGSGAATDLYLQKRVAGTLTTLGTPFNADLVVNDVVSVEVRGTSLTVKENGVSRITATDTFCDDAVGVGLGVGALRDTATDDATTGWHFDDFTVVDQDASSGAISLASGANTIIVTATAVDKVTTTDTITVTLAASDTVLPVVTITSPTTTPTQGTSVAAITISGTCTDNVACTSVALACPQCTPTSAACTLTGTSFTCAAVTQAAGANVLTATGQDAAANSGTDALTSTFTASDVTAPVLTITSNGGANFNTAVNPFTLQGTATDAVGVTSVSCACDVCQVGTPSVGSGTSVAWSVPLTLAQGANAVSCTARDQADNVSSADTITITFSPGALTLASATLPNGRVSEAYATFRLSATGGTAPYTFSNNGAGTSLNDGDAQCAGLSIEADGDIVGTPTTEGTCTWTGKVTDNVAATDTEPYTLVIVAAGAAGPHDFFTTAIARSDCFKAYSFRPVAGVAQPSAAVGVADCTKPNWAAQLGASTFASYDFAGDTHAEKQDAMKMRVPQWRSVPALTLASPLSAASSGDTSSMTISTAQGIETGKAWKIDDEIVVAPATVPTSATFNVLRGQFGTTAASHSAGATVLTGSNSVGTTDQVRVPIVTDGSVTATYLYIVDLYYTTSFMRTGLVNHKTLQVSFISSGNQFVETNANYQGPTSLEPNPEWASSGGVNTNVAAFGTRFYGQSTTLNARQDNPGRPMANPPFIIKPSKWLRFWIFIEANAETDSSKFSALSGGRAPLAAAITDTTSTSISIDHTNITTNPFTACPFECAGASWPGRALKIDNEILTVSGCTVCSGTTRTLTVVRGAQSTTPATHTLGTQVQTLDDYVTIYVADEDQNPTLMYDRVAWHIPINHATASSRGSMFNFWIEFNTSTAQTTQGRANGADGVPGTSDDFADLVAYVRNLVVLKDPPADWSALRVKPVR